MAPEPSMCTLSYCQRNFDDIIFLLQKINSKFNHINKSSENQTFTTISNDLKSIGDQQENDKKYNLSHNETMDVLKKGNERDTELMNIETKAPKKRGRKKRKDG